MKAWQKAARWGRSEAARDPAPAVLAWPAHQEPLPQPYNAADDSEHSSQKEKMSKKMIPTVTVR